MTEHASSPHTTSSADRRVSGWWRALAIFLLVLLSVGTAASVSMFEQFKAHVAELQRKLDVIPQVRQIAVLLDGKQLPALLVTQETHAGVLQLQRLNEVKEGREDSMQLWALAVGQPPRSLGVIESKFKTLLLPTTPDALAGVTSLAISVENKGGVPEAQGPRLPYLFEGALVQKGL